jgi:hypothetical protein
MRNRFLFLSVFLMCICFFPKPAYSQQTFLIEGTVYNVETNKPVPHASIIVSGTTAGTSSDPEGHFELRLKEGKYKISISSVGFSDKDISLLIPSDTREHLRIALYPGELEIEGVDIYGDFYLADNDSSIDRVTMSILPAVTRISSIEIEKQGAVTLTDALKYVPGGWTESRGRKTKQFFSVRGQKYPYPDYSINGIWQKEFEETVYFFSALDIESVEIVRSSSALVKGLSGLTGVVDVKTKKPERETASLTAKYGEQNKYVTNIQYGNKINDLSFNTSVALMGTDGPPERNGKERISGFYGNSDWKINNKLTLSAGANYIYGLREFVQIVEPGSSKFLNWEEKYDPVRSLLTYAKLNYQGDDGSLTEFQGNLTSRNSVFVRYDIAEQSTSSTREKDWEYGFNLLHSRPFLAGNTLRFGVLYNHWEAPNGKRYYVGRRCNVHTWSGVIASEQKAGRFLFDAGFRLIGGHIVEWGGFGIEGSAKGFQNVEPIEDQSAPMEWQSVLGASCILSGASSLHYNFSGGSIAARKGSLNESGLNPENEVRFQHDLGIRYKSPNKHELSVSAFYTKRQNAVELSGQTLTTGNDFVVELYENLDKRSYGVEFATKMHIPAFYSFFFANATLMNGENEIDGDMEKDDKLPNLILNTGILFEYSGFDANIFAGYTGPYANNRFVDSSWVTENGDFKLGDFVSADLTAGYTFSGRFSTRLFGEVKNLLDQKYMTVAGYPDPGRLFLTGVKINY